jgi:hypothetical protein
MNDNTAHQHPPESADCPRTRLARGALVAVDACRCGMLQVHIGALTLREELATTLARAMVELAKLHPKTQPPALALVGDEGADKAEANAEVRALPARLR